jgi:acyl dehydratase
MEGARFAVGSKGLARALLRQTGGQNATAALYGVPPPGPQSRRQVCPEGERMTQAVTRTELERDIGRELGTSDWLLMEQDRVNRFADVTMDHQYVHVDPERARQTPFGGTIAHGLLTLSLIVPLCIDFVPKLAGTKLLLNYGFDKVRFSAPVRVGKRIRAHCKLSGVEERKPGNVIVKLDVKIEVEDEEKPALIAEWLSLHVLE